MLLRELLLLEMPLRLLLWRVELPRISLVARMMPTEVLRLLLHGGIGQRLHERIWHVVVFTGTCGEVTSLIRKLLVRRWRKL